MKPRWVHGVRYRALTAAVALACGAGLLAGCAGEPSPAPTIRDFLLAWQSGDYRGAAKLTDGDTVTVAKALRGAERSLDTAAIQFRLGDLTMNGDRATSDFRAYVDLGENGPPWRYQGHMRLHRTSGTWRIVWSPTVIHPSLRAGQRLAVQVHVPQRAGITDRAGHSLVKRVPVAVIGVYPSRLHDVVGTTAKIAKLTGLQPDQLLGRVRSAPPHRFTPLVTLRIADYRKLRGRLHAIRGLHFRRGTAPYGAKYAPGVLGSVGTATRRLLRTVAAPYQAGDSVGLSGLQVAYQRKLAGTPTTRVVTVGRGGTITGVLKTWHGDAGTDVTTTIDLGAERAARHALAVSGADHAAIVAIDADTGQIRAVAGRPFGTTSPFTGKLPPGDVFTIVSADALLGAGVRLGDKMPCLTERNVGGRVFHSPSGATRWDKTPNFLENFARTCSTAFAGLSRKLKPGTIAAAARQYGIGGDWKLPVPTFPGSVPNATREASRAAQTVGQGGIKVSALDMAQVAATVDSGTWRAPSLVTSPAPQRQPQRPVTLPAGRAAALRHLLHAGVRHGAAEPAGLPGVQVSGQVGYARAGHQIAQWFVGYRGSLAFAVADYLPATQSGTEVAAATAKAFLAALPHGKRHRRSSGGGS